MTSTRKTNFSRWLEILQQESWQLELLISGFAIFLLAEAYGPIHHLDYRIDLLAISNPFYGILYIPYRVFLGAWYVLLINLIMHVLLRGLWISTIGLRYISGEIDFELMNFNLPFDRFLRRRIKSFDIYIQQLEKLCSVVFGFTFLIIFILLSGGLFAIGALLLIWILNAADGTGGFWTLLVIPVITCYIVGGLLYFIDFITMGYMKQKLGSGRFYYPVYRFFSAITLSFVYRPIYYNMIDNKFGRGVVLFLIPYLLFFSLFASVSFRTHAYLPADRVSVSFANEAYDDTWDKNRPTYSASIPSKFVENGFIDLYLPYIPEADDKVIHQTCPDLEPAAKGIYFFGLMDPARLRMPAAEALECHARRYRIYVNDSLHNALSYRFYEHPLREDIGFLTVVDVAYLPRGEHNLGIVVNLPETSNGRDTLMFRETIRIPFWKE